MLKISSGLVRNRGVSWFPELVDKSRCIIHFILLYGGANSSREEHQNPPILGHEELRWEGRQPETAHRQHPKPLPGLIFVLCSHSYYIYITNIQGDHSCCHPSSACHMPRYTPSKVELKNTQAVKLLSKTLREMYIYRFAEVLLGEHFMCDDSHSTYTIFSAETHTQWSPSTI